MEVILWTAVVLLAAVAGLLAVRLWCYQKQIRHIRKQLSFLQAEESNLLLSSVCAVGKTPEMICQMNALLEQARQEQCRLRKANKAYRESITSISHDIRTPLTSVKGYVQLLQDKDIPEEKRAEYIQIVLRRLKELGTMLDQLFEYARIEAGEFPLHMEPINMGNLFAEILSMFYEEFSSRGFEPQVEIAREAMFIQADRHACSRIIENLIKNALVHGTGNFRFLAAAQRGRAVISIANETDQIEEKDLERIFDRFFTTDQSRSRKTTGLGLAIARRFTEQMQGTIKAEIREGYFTVEVSFPMERDL